MSLLFNWRVWVALALAGVLAFTHLTAYRKGKHAIQVQWDLAVATANSDARKLEQQRQRRADESAQLAAAREAGIRAAAAVARRERDGLRDDLSAVRDHARQSLDACTVSLTATADVFEQCVGRYSDLAEEADRHASDSLKLQQSWPTK